MSIVSPARVRLLFCVLLVAASALAALSWAPPGGARPAALRPGAGYRLPGGDFVGFYLTRAGVKVFCLDPGKRAPTSVSLTTVTRYRGMTQPAADELAYALATWGNPRNRAQAAAESQVVNTVAGNGAAVRRRARALPASVNRAVAAHLRAVRSLHGPYTLQVRAARAASPGQSAVGTAVVVAATRAGVPGVYVRLRGSGNVHLPASVRTGAHGRVAFRYTVTGVGPVRIRAEAFHLPSRHFLGSHPPRGQQRMVTWSPTVGAVAQTGFQARLGALSHRYACITTCDGRPRTTVHACAAASAYVTRLIVRAGRTSTVVEYPASGRTRCRSVTLVLADRDRVTASWTFRAPGGWTSPVAAGGAFVIDCPAVPAVQAVLSYTCAAGSFAATVTAPAAHPAALVVGGAVQRRIEARAGAAARFSTAVRCGTVQSFTVQAGVRRADGAWNYGPLARISTPGAARQP